MFIVEALYYIHWLIYILSVVSIIMLIKGGDSIYVNAAMLFIGGLLITQAVWNGCPITDLQNIARSAVNLPPLENKFILSYLMGDKDVSLLRIVAFITGLFILFTVRIRVKDILFINL